MIKIFKPLSLIAIVTQSTVYYSSQCHSMENLTGWFSSSSGDKKNAPKHFKLTPQCLGLVSAEEASSNFAYVSPLIFTHLFGRADMDNVTPGYIRIYKVSKDPYKDYENDRLDKCLGILSILSKSGIKEDQIFMNSGLEKYIRSTDNTFGWITSSAIDFSPINSTHLQPARYINFDVRINTQRIPLKSLKRYWPINLRKNLVESF